MTARSISSLAVVLLLGCGSAGNDMRFADCRRVLLDQARAWNHGDLEGFARGYLAGPHTVFAGAGHATLGHAQMLARYRKRYPDREAMGKLVFSELRFEAIDAKTVLARGRWQLHRKADAPTGQFVLVMRRVAGAWRVVLDYTTAAGE